MIGLTPHLMSVTVRAHGVLGLVFADGMTGDVEVLSRMNGPVFERARTVEGFATAELDADAGTVTWPGGADLAPDTLYQRVKTGAWPGERTAA
ncbi:MAG: DUF2442 domain-containing protein [Gemmatimonadaceae bacterium]